MSRGVGQHLVENLLATPVVVVVAVVVVDVGHLPQLHCWCILEVNIR